MKRLKHARLYDSIRSMSTSFCSSLLNSNYVQEEMVDFRKSNFGNIIITSVLSTTRTWGENALGIRCEIHFSLEFSLQLTSFLSALQDV
jgi:hypothetical protein